MNRGRHRGIQPCIKDCAMIVPNFLWKFRGHVLRVFLLGFWVNCIRRFIIFFLALIRELSYISRLTASLHGSERSPKPVFPMRCIPCSYTSADVSYRVFASVKLFHTHIIPSHYCPFWAEALLGFILSNPPAMGLPHAPSGKVSKRLA